MGALRSGNYACSGQVGVSPLLTGTVLGVAPPNSQGVGNRHLFVRVKSPPRLFFLRLNAKPFFLSTKVCVCGGGVMRVVPFIYLLRIIIIRIPYHTSIR